MATSKMTTSGMVMSGMVTSGKATGLMFSPISIPAKSTLHYLRPYFLQF